VRQSGGAILDPRSAILFWFTPTPLPSFLPFLSGILLIHCYL
jgi:hypothetical protein